MREGQTMHAKATTDIIFLNLFSIICSESSKIHSGGRSVGKADSEMPSSRQLAIAFVVAVTTFAAVTSALDCVVCTYGLDSRGGGGEGRCEGEFDFESDNVTQTDCEVCVKQTSEVYYHNVYYYRSCWNITDVPKGVNLTGSGRQECIDVSTDEKITVEQCFCITQPGDPPCNAASNVATNLTVAILVAIILSLIM